MDQPQPAPPAPPRRRRPPGVIITTLLLLLTAISAFLVAAAVFVDSSVGGAYIPVLGETSDLIALIPAPAAVVGAGAILVGGCTLVVAIGFFRLRRWGWTGLMLLAAVSLSINLAAVVIGNPDEGTMAVAIAAVLYANQGRIQLLFRGEQVAAFTGASEGARTTDVRPPR